MAQTQQVYTNDIGEECYQAKNITVAGGNIVVTLPTLPNTSQFWHIVALNASTDQAGSLTCVSNSITVSSTYLQGTTNMYQETVLVASLSEQQGFYDLPGISGIPGFSVVITLPCTTNGSLCVRAKVMPVRTFRQGMEAPLG